MIELINMIEKNFLNNLNKDQKSIILSSNKNILVLAGAGSGKTRVLIYKILWLTLKKKINPNSILAITFTNKAADQINKKISLLKDNLDISIETFHSISYKILKIYYKYANLSNNFQVINNYDQLKIIKNILKLYKFNNNKYNPLYILDYINRNKNNGIREKDIICNNSSDMELLEIYIKYQNICNKLNLIDFSELIIRSYELFLYNNNILNIYIKKYKNILIDEFQDLNTIQYFWIKILSNNEFVNITVVGDDDQSIYGWRGANINNINKFLEDFKNVKVFYLEQNYRSTKNIIEAANYLILNNKFRSNKKLWTNKKNGNLINIYRASNEIEEAKFISNYILKNIKKNINNKTCAILYRNNYQSRILEEYLLYNNIKYQIYGGLKFIDRKEIKNSICYLRLISDENDNISYEKIINFPSRKIGFSTLELVKKISIENNFSYWKSTLYIINNNLLFKKTFVNKLSSFVKLIEFIKNNIINDILPDKVSKIIKFSGLLDIYKKEEINNYIFSSKIDNINELINSSQIYYNKFIKLNKNLNIQDFLSYLFLKSDNYDNKLNNSIKLMTLHSSKGLEFDLVFIVGMEEGIFPINYSLLDEKILEEERRLAYVGLTRAINNIIITYSEYKYVHGKLNLCKPSRFIKEIPNKFINFLN